MDGHCEYVLEVDCPTGDWRYEVPCDPNPCEQPGGPACPRSVGFWKQQTLCSQGEGGRVKFSCMEMEWILECVDATSVFFDWDDDLADFTAAVNPDRPMDLRKQASRQYAAFLANMCVGQLGIPANNGDMVSLPPGTEITGTCFEFDATTIGELIAELDPLLIDLQDEPMDNATKQTYADIVYCLDDINNARGIPYDPDECEYDEDDGTPPAQPGRDTAGSPLDDHLYKPSPNPFSDITRMTYSVDDQGGSNVEISVYDAAGRRIRSLVSEFKASGQHDVEWDGRSDQGTKVPAAIYFYRVRIGEQEQIVRAIYMR
jgi:hypothetical protein